MTALGGPLSDPESPKAFSLAGAPDETARPDAGKETPAGIRALSRLVDEGELDRLRRAVAAAGEAAYHWVIESDEIFWSANASDLFDCTKEALATGRSFAAHLDAENFASRYDAVMHAASGDEGDGVAFQIECLFRPDGRMGRRSLWIEDSGRWYADAHGKSSAWCGG